MRFNEKATRNYQRRRGREAKTWAIASFVGLVGTPRMTRAALPKKSESSGFILRSAQIISLLFRRFVSDYLVQNVLLSASRPPHYPRSSGCELHQCAIQNELGGLVVRVAVRNTERAWRVVCSSGCSQPQSASPRKQFQRRTRRELCYIAQVLPHLTVLSYLFLPPLGSVDPVFLFGWARPLSPPA